MGTSAAVLIKNNFRLADRIKIQQETIRKADYTIIGRLSAILFEGQRSISGLSQSRPRFTNRRQAQQSRQTPDPMHPFSEKQAILWASITLDWLSPKNAPMIAISRDQQDLLLPHGLAPLPPIPDPRFVATHAASACPNSKNGCADCIAPRIPQKLVGCPVVGDRVRDMIRARDGHMYGVLQPISAMSILIGGEKGGFFKIKGAVRDGMQLALLLDDQCDPMQGYFTGGGFTLGD